MWRGVAKVMLGPAGLPGRRRPLLREPGGRHLQGGDGEVRPRRHDEGLRLRGGGHRLRRRRLDGHLRGQRLQPQLPLPQPRRPRLRERRADGRRGPERRRPRPGRAWAPTPATSTATAGSTSRSPPSPSTTTASTGTSATGRFEDVSQAAGLAAATFKDMSWGLAFLDADLDGDLDLYYANGHLFPQVDEHPELQETYAQKDQIFLNEGGRFRDVSATAGRGLAVQKCSRAVAVGDLDNDGDPDLVVSAMDEAADAAREHPAERPSLARGRGEAEGPQSPSPSGRGSPSRTPAAGSRSARSAPAAATSRRTTCAPCSGSAPARGRSPSRCGSAAKRWRFPGVAVDRHVTLVLDDEHRVPEP